MVKDWTCTSCGLHQDFEQGKSIFQKCPGCDSNSCRVVYRQREDFKPSGQRCGVDALMVENERLSGAMSCLPREVPEMMKMYPGSEYRVDESGLAKLVIHNRNHKLSEMKKRGWSEIE